MQSARYFCPILVKFVISWQIFMTLPILQFHRSPSSVTRAGTWGQTDRRTNGWE